MAIYRFKVSFEDYDAVREIDIKSNQTFEDFHYAIQKSIGYQPDYASSFYVSNDYWHKGTEITRHAGKGKDASAFLMKEAKLSRFVEDPHQKFYYTFNFEHPIDFHIELIKILDKDPGVEYPVCIKSDGEAPKQFLGQLPAPAGSEEPEEPEPGEESLMETEEYDMDEEDPALETSASGEPELNDDEEDDLGFDDDTYDNEDIKKDDY